MLPQDVFDVARDVLRHRLMVSYEALAKGLTADDLLNRLLAVVPAAEVSPKLARPTSGVEATNGSQGSVPAFSPANIGAPGAPLTGSAPVPTILPSAPPPPVGGPGGGSPSEPTIIDPGLPEKPA